MTAPSISVSVSFPTTPAMAIFTLDDPTKGRLDSATYKLAGPTTTVDISSTVRQVAIRRGRTRSLDSFEPGTATIVVQDFDGTWNPQNSGSMFYPFIQVRRQVKITAALNGVGYALFTGLIQSFRYDYDKSNKVAYVTLECSDISSQLSQVNVTTITGAAAGDKTGTRIGQILDAISSTFSTSARQIDTGATLVQADPGTTRTALDAIRTIVDTEVGAFFVKADGTVRFVDRAGTVTGSQINPVVFADDGTGIPYLDIRMAFDDTLLSNAVTVTPNGLAAQTYNDSTSQTSFGKRSVSRTGLMTTTADAANQAAWVASQRSTPKLRCDALVLDTYSGGTQAVQALALDFFSALTVRHLHTGTLTTFPVFVQGVEHDITPGSWRTTLRVAEASTGFVLDVSQLDVGILTY